MPVYEYACTNCGERTEARQSFTDPPLEKCPFCGGKLRKLYSPVGVVFKGTGFYATDARKSASTGSSEGSKSGDAKGDSKSPKKADAKASGGDSSSSSSSSADKSD